MSECVSKMSGGSPEGKKSCARVNPLKPYLKRQASSFGVFCAKRSTDSDTLRYRAAKSQLKTKITLNTG